MDAPRPAAGEPRRPHCGTSDGAGRRTATCSRRCHTYWRRCRKRILSGWGDGPLARELRIQARSLGVAAHVHLLGARRDVAALLAAAHLFVLPSHFEGLPLAPLEAMAAGVPVVGTAVCGTAEVVANRVTGRLVAARSPRLLAAAIIEHLARPDLAQRRGAAGRERVERHFTAERMVRETAACYEAVRTRHWRGIYEEPAEETAAG